MSEPIQSIAQNNYILQAPPPTATMFTTELEYDGDKISGYAGSAFKAGTDLEFGYDSADNISAINNSALTDVNLNNIVQTNSGAWGGSALPISAGPGIKVNLVDNTLVFSNDETVLWSGASTEFITPSITGKTLSESPSNFEKLEIWAVWNPWEGNTPVATYYPGNVTAGSYMVFDQAQFMRAGYGKWTISNNVIKMVSAAQTTNWPSFQAGSTYGGIVKVIGINRIAGGN